MGNRAGNAVNKKSGTDHNSEGETQSRTNGSRKKTCRGCTTPRVSVIKVNILKPQIDERQRSTR